MAGNARVSRRLIIALAAGAVGAVVGLALWALLDRTPSRLRLLSAKTAAALTVSPTGNDGSCSRGGSACATFERAYELAEAGDTVAVDGGAYAADYPAEGATKLLPRGPRGVRFVCGDGNPITFVPPADQFVITAQNVTISGSCFHFNRLWIGDAPNGVSTSGVTVDGVEMMMFQVSGSSNVTISNATVGPDTACGPPGDGAASCQNLAATGEAYFVQAGEGNTEYTSPKINTGGPSGAVPSTVSLLNDTFVNHQTRDSGQWHGECLFIDNAGGSERIEGGSFSGCFFADIFVNSPSSWGVTISGVSFAASKEPINGGTSLAAIPDTSPAFVDVAVKCEDGEVVSDWTITGNTFAHGWDLNWGGCSSPSYPQLTIGGNTGGTTQSPGHTRPPATPSPPPPG